MWRKALGFTYIRLQRVCVCHGFAPSLQLRPNITFNFADPPNDAGKAPKAPACKHHAAESFSQNLRKKWRHKSGSERDLSHCKEAGRREGGQVRGTKLSVVWRQNARYRSETKGVWRQKRESKRKGNISTYRLGSSRPLFWSRPSAE